MNVAKAFGRAQVESPTFQVVVHSSEDGNVGFVVDAIEDVVDEVVDATRRSGRTGTLGSAVIQGRVTELLDAHAVRSMARTR